MTLHVFDAAVKNRVLSLIRSSRYGITNTLLITFIVALLAESWCSWLVVGATILAAGPLDEATDEMIGSAGDRARLFYQVNLYATLPLLLVVTGLYLRVIAKHAHGQDFGDLVATIGAFAATGTFYGLAGATVAHELVHRTNTLALVSARLLLALSLNPSFESYHIPVHHRHVATARDASTAWQGEYILAFLARTVALQFLAGYSVELERLRVKGKAAFSLQNRVLFCFSCSLIVGATAFLSGGSFGVLGFLSAAILGRFLHESVNYLQHYGLVRVEGSPIEARHAWDTYRSLTTFLQYNLSRHSHHHLNGGKPFWDLQPMANAPRLPHGYATMVLLAFMPAVWRRTMNPLLLDWNSRLASENERALIHQRNWS